MNADVVKKRNHQLEGKTLPIIIEDKFETLKRQKKYLMSWEKIGFAAELERAKIKKSASRSRKDQRQKIQEESRPA